MININQDKNSFTLNYKGITVINHSSRKPCIEIGNGRPQVSQSHGNYKIKDRIIEKTACRNFTIRQVSDNELEINFLEGITVKAEEQKGRLVLSFSDTGSHNRFWIHFLAYEDEMIFGGGEQYSTLNLKGKKFPIWTQEQGVGRGKDLITLLMNIHSHAGGAWYTTYFPQPTFVSTKNYFYHADETAYGELDFRDKNYHNLIFWEIPKKITFSVKDNLLNTVTDLSDFLGRQPRIPDWVNDGLILGLQSGTETIEKKLKIAQENGIKITGLWVQDWVGKRITKFGSQLMWDWHYNKKLYPDLPETIKKLKQNNIKFLAYINPYLALEGELYREAQKKGYCIKDKTGKDYYVDITTFPAAIIDLTNPEAVDWVKRVIKENLIDIGISGWMNDYGEYLPVDSITKSGEDSRIVHNLYPTLWAKVNYEVIVESGKQDDIVFFSRAGFTGISKYSPLIWAGDQLTNWSMDDGLASAVLAGISCGFIGIGVTHSEIAGFTAIAWIRRSKELFLRWLEYSVFTPVMRSHEGNRPADNWQFDSDNETLKAVSNMSSLFVKLKPYRKHTIEEYYLSGIPAIRHLMLHYQNDRETAKLAYQYLFGRDLMVAPVYKKNKRKWKLYLPDDSWIHLWSGKKYSQGWVLVDAPIGQPPVFYREKSNFKELFSGFKL